MLRPLRARVAQPLCRHLRTRGERRGAWPSNCRRSGRAKEAGPRHHGVDLGRQPPRPTGRARAPRAPAKHARRSVDRPPKTGRPQGWWRRASA
eukprot:6074610-Alexandrium_andersonii.AAC.1